MSFRDDVQIARVAHTLCRLARLPADQLWRDDGPTERCCELYKSNPMSSGEREMFYLGFELWNGCSGGQPKRKPAGFWLSKFSLYHALGTLDARQVGAIGDLIRAHATSRRGNYGPLENWLLTYGFQTSADRPDDADSAAAKAKAARGVIDAAAGALTSPETK